MINRFTCLRWERQRKRFNHKGNYSESLSRSYIIKEYKDIIKTNKKKTIHFAYQPTKAFRKLKGNRKFKSLIEPLKITMGTITFKVNIVNLVDKYSKMMTPSITLNFLKSYYKDIKNICK